MFDIKYDVDGEEEECATATRTGTGIQGACESIEETQKHTGSTQDLELGADIISSPSPLRVSELQPPGGAGALIEEESNKMSCIIQSLNTATICAFMLQFFCSVTRITFTFSDFVRPFTETFDAVKRLDFFVPYFPPLIYPGWVSYMVRTFCEGTLS